MKRTMKYLSAFAIAAAVTGFGLVSCSKDDALPAIDGFNNSNEVASASLLAHWTFDGTNNETISNTAPTTATGNSFTTGIKDQALALNKGYLLFPTIAALSTANATPSVTISLWVNVANNGTAQSNIFGLAQSTSVGSDWNTGPYNVYVETGSYKTGNDTLQFHSNFTTYISNVKYSGDNVTNYGVKGTDYLPVVGANKWIHYIMRYNGSESNIDLFANGIRVSNNKFRHRTYSPSGVETGLGNVLITPPTQVVIGGWANLTTGFTNSAAQTWQGLLTGSVDEIRVYSKSLSDAEIGSLYQLELAGR